jgi:hypothetical protein
VLFFNDLWKGTVPYMFGSKAFVMVSNYALTLRHSPLSPELEQSLSDSWTMACLTSLLLAQEVTKKNPTITFGATLKLGVMAAKLNTH